MGVSDALCDIDGLDIVVIPVGDVNHFHPLPSGCPRLSWADFMIQKLCISNLVPKARQSGYFERTLDAGLTATGFIKWIWFALGVD
jgi:hypothetical protein